MNISPERPPTETRIDLSSLWSWLLALICLAAAGGWLLLAREVSETPAGQPQSVQALTSGIVARMDSPVFDYSDGWRIPPEGADPSEPADAWNEPAGQMTFAYTGRELALQLAVGDYWGYIFVTVDGAPANRLANIRGHKNSRGNAAGYKPLLAPERQTSTGPAALWVPVHSATDDGPHTVEVEVWRGWDQIPLRGVAVDALPAPPLPLWPAAIFGLGTIGALYFVLKNRTRMTRIGRISADKKTGHGIPEFRSALIRWIRVIRVLFPFRFWPVALLLIGAGVFLDNWLLTDAGLVLLALAALLRPERWIAALLFGLPFYLYPLPILPGRALNLIEIGVWGGLLLLGMRNAEWRMRNWIVPLAEAQRRREGEEGKRQKGKAKVSALSSQSAIRNSQFAIYNSQSALFPIICLALLSSLTAQYTDLALREWRTVFLAGGGFALLLGAVLTQSDDPKRSRRVLVNAWLAGGTVMALIALWQFTSGQMLIQAEGVARVRGLYGSPNNLALYLERTLAVGIGYWIFGMSYSVSCISYSSDRRDRWLRNTQYAILLLPQLAALVLTFSKGALFLGFPAMLLVLGGGGIVLLARQGISIHPRWTWRFLWWLAGIGAIVVLGLLPFLGTERFRLLLDFGAGTTGGLRLNLWRSAWAMALDHPWLGVGPDNFLYAYRSGYILPTAWQDPNLNHPHNFVLDWWTRLGLPGLLLAGLWIGGGVRGLWRQLRRGGDAGLALGCLAAIAAALAHGLIDASYGLPDLMLVWVLLLHFSTAQYPQSPRPELRC